jgi:hypothetical protein
MQAATALDPRSVTVGYTVELSGVSSFDIAIYRSATATFNPAQDVKLADDIVSGSNATQGAHTGVALSLPGPMAIDPAHPFVFAVATGPDSMTSTADFQKVIIGVVTHGFESPLADEPPQWVTDMANTLMKSDGYNFVIPFNWVPESSLPISGEGVAAGEQVATMVETALKNTAIVPTGAVVDLHFIAHSRGSVVITTALQQLATDLPNQPAIQGGYWRETLLDPHPSHFLNKAELGHTLNPISLAAWASGVALQSGMDDPLPLMIPARVTELQDYFERTPMSLLGANSPFLFTTENFLNPYGVSLNNGLKLVDPNATIYNAQPLTAPGIGHSETYQWYVANVLPTLGTAGPFIRGPIDAPLSGSAYNLSATVGSELSDVYVGEFTDPDPTSTPQDFTSTVNWGDGTSSPGIVVSSIFGGYYVEGSHTYSSSGTFNTTVTINDVAPNGGGAKLVVTAQASVSQSFISAIGSPQGALPFVTLVDTGTGHILAHFLAYAPGFAGGVQVVRGDVTGDGVPDIITAPITGGQGLVNVFDGRTDALIRSFRPFPNLRTGIKIGVGDVDGDNHADIIVSLGPGSLPLVTVFSGKDGSRVAQVQAAPIGFRGGVSLTVGDVNHDGLADVQALTIQRGQAVTKLFDGKALSRIELAHRPTPFQQFLKLRKLVFGLAGRHG